MALSTFNPTSEFIFKNAQYSFQALRAVAAANGKAADIGECLAALKAIREEDDESWYREWFQLAQRIESQASTSKEQGHKESARGAYLRASNYYRSAEFFLHINPEDPRILHTWGKSRECFREAAKLNSSPIIEVRIPFEKSYLPGYLCLCANDDSPKPLVILQTGFDGTAEELYYQVAADGLVRGYNFLLFDGPGQGGVIREQNIPFRSNWESVVTPVVDFALDLKQVDSARIALVGISFGGYLVPRALAFEPRIKIGVVNGGVYDFGQVCMRQELAEYADQLNDSKIAKEIDKAILKAMESDSTIRWVFGNGMFTFQASSPSQLLRMVRSYHLRDCISEIKIKMLVMDSEHDEDMPLQSKQFYDHLQCPKEYMLFQTYEGAGEHCQIGAYAYSNESLFNWLDKNL